MSESKPKTVSALVLVAVAICLVFGANAWKSSLRVKNIIIEGNRVVGKNEVLQLSHVQKDELLYRIDLTAVQRNVSSHHYIKDAIIERNLPHSIHIQITERIPVAMVNRSETLYLDDTGIILPPGITHKLLDLPMISGVSSSEPLTFGATVTQPDVIEALRILTLLKTVNRAMYHNISEVHIRNGGDILLYSTEGGVPIIFGRGELPDKIVRLEAFWNTVVRTRGPQTLKYIDLRYQDQIVARWVSDPLSTKGL